MNVFDRYFQKNKVVEYPVFSHGTVLMVVIPVFDDPEIFDTLRSLSECDGCEGKVGVIIVVNHSEKCDEEVKLRNRELTKNLKQWITENSCNVIPNNKTTDSGIEFLLLEAFDLPERFAGVGLARKIGMDVAADYFYREGREDGVIASLDADTFVSVNYTEAIVRFFRENAVAGASVSFAHRIGEVASEQLKDAIIKYELYLRYYLFALRYTGHPYAFHCIGSAFAVRASDYVAQGGMNRKQAGEDFYFLQKLIATGRFREIIQAKVYPSARISDRTPFGTGQSVRQIVENNGSFRTYDFEAFRLLRVFFDGIPALYKAGEDRAGMFCYQQPDVLRDFLKEIDFIGMINEVNGNCASEKQFVKRFFDNFNAFQVLKFLNYSHSNTYTKIDIISAVNAFLIITGKDGCEEPSRLLDIFRMWEDDDSRIYSKD